LPPFFPQPSQTKVNREWLSSKDMLDIPFSILTAYCDLSNSIVEIFAKAALRCGVQNPAGILEYWNTGMMDC
jgi:hypothetical protein